MQKTLVMQFTVRSGRVNEQHIEPEQAGKCNKNQDYISDKSSCMDSKSFFQIFIFVHNNTSPFYSTHAFLLSFPVTLKTIRLKIAVMMNRITDTAPAIP